MGRDADPPWAILAENRNAMVQPRPKCRSGATAPPPIGQNHMDRMATHPWTMETLHGLRKTKRNKHAAKHHHGDPNKPPLAKNPNPNGQPDPHPATTHCRTNPHTRPSTTKPTGTPSLPHHQPTDSQPRIQQIQTSTKPEHHPTSTRQSNKIHPSTTTNRPGHHASEEPGSNHRLLLQDMPNPNNRINLHRTMRSTATQTEFDTTGTTASFQHSCPRPNHNNETDDHPALKATRHHQSTKTSQRERTNQRSFRENPSFQQESRAEARTSSQPSISTMQLHSKPTAGRHQDPQQNPSRVYPRTKPDQTNRHNQDAGHQHFRHPGPPSHPPSQTIHP